MIEQDIKKWLNSKIPSFCEEFENIKKKEQNFFDLSEWGFEPQIFMESEARPNQNKLPNAIGL